MSDIKRLREVGFSPEEAKAMGLGFPGELKFGMWVSSPSELWLLCDGKTIGSAVTGADYAAATNRGLFDVLWAGQGAIYTSVGAASTRGLSAQADWDSEKILALPDARLRTLIGAKVGESGFQSGNNSTLAAGKAQTTVKKHYHGMGAGADLTLSSSVPAYLGPGGGGWYEIVNSAGTTNYGTVVSSHFVGSIGCVTGGVDGNTDQTINVDMPYVACTCIISL